MSSQRNTIPAGLVRKENWRKILHPKRVLNCPCRGAKKDYTRAESFLKHYAVHHPEQYDEVRKQFGTRRKRKR